MHPGSLVVKGWQGPVNRVSNSPIGFKSDHYPCAANCRATDVVLREDISAARVLELVEHDAVIPNVILDGVILQPRAFPIPVIQVRFLVPSSVRSRRGRSPGGGLTFPSRSASSSSPRMRWAATAKSEIAESFGFNKLRPEFQRGLDELLRGRRETYPSGIRLLRCPC